MKVKQFLRNVLCFILIICFVFNFTVTRAYAIEPVTAYCLVSALSVVLSSLISLGVEAGTDTLAHSDIANRVVNDMVDSGSFVANGFVKIMTITSDTGIKAYVPSGMLEWIRNWLYQNDVISDCFVTSFNPGSSFVGYKTMNSSASFCPYWFTFSWNNTICGGFVSTTPNAQINFTTSSGGSGSDTLSKNYQGYYYNYFTRNNYSDTSWVNTGVYLGHYDSAAIDIYNSEDILRYIIRNYAYKFAYTSQLDVSLGDVSPEDEDLSVSYPTWSEESVSITDTETEVESTFYPVSIPDSDELIQEQTQSEAQTGTISQELFDSLTQVFDDTFDGSISTTPWTTFKTWFSEHITGLKNAIISLPQAIADTFTNFWTTVTTWLENLHTAVLSIPQAIADVLADIFIPAEDYISVKVEALAAEYAFVPDIVDSVTLMKNNLVGDGGPPVIYVDFGRAGGNTNYGGKVLLTDFAWYEEYKPTVDALLSAALWAFFLWRVFLKLPGIIGGESAAVGSAFTSYTRRGRDD